MLKGKIMQEKKIFDMNLLEYIDYMQGEGYPEDYACREWHSMHPKETDEAFEIGYEEY